MLEVFLKKGKEKSLLRRHPWVYDTAVGRVAGKPGVGETVRVLASDGRFLGFGAYSPSSTLRVRMWAFDEKAPVESPAFFRTNSRRPSGPVSRFLRVPPRGALFSVRPTAFRALSSISTATGW